MLSERVRLPEITLTIDERRETSLTSVGSVGDRVLGVATTIPGWDFELVSCYLHEPSGAIGASHLELAANPSQPASYRLMPADEVAGADAGWCVLDHASRLHDVLARTHGPGVLVDVPLAALERLAHGGSR
jgi:hypothetical protein